MKYLFLTLLFIQSSLACQISIPESYIPIFLSPPVSGAYVTCELDQKEPCHCVDMIDPWASELIDETDEAGIYTGKKILQNSPSKKAANDAAKEAARSSAEIKETQKKNFNFKGTTIMQIRAELNDYLEMLK